MTGDGALISGADVEMRIRGRVVSHVADAPFVNVATKGTVITVPESACTVITPPLTVNEIVRGSDKRLFNAKKKTVILDLTTGWVFQKLNTGWYVVSSSSVQYLSHLRNYRVLNVGDGSDA